MQLWIAAGAALLMAGLFVEALIFRALHDDPPATYKLFAVRDRLIRLVAERKVDPNDPTFQAIYRNITILLRSTRCLSGPSGWEVAEQQGKALAHGAQAQRLEKVPRRELSSEFQPVMNELGAALHHLLNNHFGIFVQMDTKRREIGRMQKQQAKELLCMMRDGGLVKDNGLCKA
jgi:hypothetical protein